MSKALAKRPDAAHLKLPRYTNRRRIARAITWSSLGLLVLLAPETVGFVGLGAIFGGLCWIALRIYRAASPPSEQIEELMSIFELLNHGDVDAASERLDELAKAVSEPLEQLTTVALLGWVRGRQQRFEEALQLLNEAATSLNVPSSVRTIARTEAAEVLALQGSLDQADELARKTHDARRYAPASLAVVWCRLGKLEKVLTLGNVRVPKAVRPYVGHTERKLSLMKAWAQHELGGKTVRGHHAKAQPAFEGEYDYLSDNWPELKQYLEQHPWDGLRPVVTHVPKARIVKKA